MLRSTIGILLSCVGFVRVVAPIGLILSSSAVFAGSATWLSTPGSGDWNTASNWTAGGPPNGAADTATFQLSAVSDISISADTQVNGITFDAGGATLYTITASPTFALTISGSGITNNSGITQNFVAAGNNGVIQFANSATAGFNTAFTTNGGAVSGAVFGVTEFRDSSNAGNGVFTTNGGAVSGAFGGVTQFFDSSTAGNGTFTNNGRAVSGAGSGVTLFFNSSTAGNGAFTNNGTAVIGEGGSFMVFFDSSTAGNGTFINNGAAVMAAGSGVTLFFNSSSAGNGTFTNNGGRALLAKGGVTQFLDSSSAANGTFIINGGAVSGGDGAVMQFFNTSTAANGTFTTNGGAVSGEGGGTMFFNDRSSAGNGTFTTNGITANAAAPGNMRFSDSSTAGNGTFITNGGGTNGAGGGGVITFADNSSAGNATFTTNGSTRSDGSGGAVEFRNNSSAGNGTFITNGSAFRHFVCPAEFCGGDYPSPAGQLFFLETTTAANATLIANGGTDGGDGGSILLGSDCMGCTARVEVFGNGNLDISVHNGPVVTVGSIEGNGVVFLGGDNLTVGSNNLSTIFSGVVQDGGINGGTGGSLTKIGAGTLILSGANTYTGDTNINSGVLQIDGSITSAAFVNPGGALAGSGTIVGNATNSGMVSPGDSPGTLTVAGGYTQNANGTLRIEIAGLTVAQHDLLSVGGSASLDGKLQLLRLDNFAPMNGDQVIILSAGTAVNGTFSTVTDNFPGLIQPTVVYDLNDVRVVFALANTFQSQAVTPNQEAVAENLDAAVGDPRATALINFLGNELLGNLPHDYDLIAPEELASIYEIAFSQATIQSLNIQRRTDDIRAGSTGFSAAGYQMRDTHGFTKGSDGKAMLDKNLAPAFVPSPENRWGVFVTGTGQFVNVGNEDFNARGYDIITGGVTLGVDYRVTPNFAIGLSGTYARSDVDLVGDGHLKADGGKLGLYATYFSGGFYLDAAAAAGWNSYDTRRTALLGDARGSTDGVEFNGLVGAGYDWNFGRLRFGPTATFQYTNIDINSFIENGSLAALRFPDQSENSLRSTLGLRLWHDWKMGGIVLRPQVRAAWQHEYNDRAYPIDSQFASGAGNIFTVHGPQIGRDSALVSAGVALLWNERVSTYIYYDGQFARDNYDSSNISGGVRISF